MPGTKSLARQLMDMSGYQQDFHCQWQHLHNPHVRALAWMLSSPVLLDTNAHVWQGAIAPVPVKDSTALQIWLGKLDKHPDALLELLQQHPSRRLGLYAETLFEFYLSEHGLLHVHGLQVHNKGANTIGEFDFILRSGSGFAHWELATKFYLYHPGTKAGPGDLYDYLGPNLADSLGAKLRKILGPQLALSRHPLAQAVLPGTVTEVRALVLGWLFYREPDNPSLLQPGLAAGLNAHHCRGTIWTLDDLPGLDFAQALMLDRLDWLAPAQVSLGKTQDRADIINALKNYFDNFDSPVMLALMQENQGAMQEYQRGMVVPVDWFARASALELKRAD
ncbi:DUF1853 family protein [Undibacterium sp. TS12]|uniref:DUF1853 family protein n=1 Tax=Undibacterium sp. TS12 TaxID=2908202 RepID=UPI001F4CDFD6|nr:DUF1853 family protein [Undibacterium sp. TS12]MCH8619089.1 DUF1853 family protein [Undibacterium sp. TS12]